MDTGTRGALLSGRSVQTHAKSSPLLGSSKIHPDVQSASVTAKVVSAELDFS